MTVAQLIPGDVVEIMPGAGRAVCVAVVDPHPVWPTLCLIVWRLDGQGDWRWSHDALLADQEIGERVAGGSEHQRRERCREALIGEGHWR